MLNAGHRIRESHVAFPGKASKYGTWSSSDDHLGQYMELLGPMPESLLARGSKTLEYFDSRGTYTVLHEIESLLTCDWRTGSLLRITNLKPTTLRNHIDGTQGRLRRPCDMSVEEVPIFVDFLQGALALDLNHRKSAAQLVQHKWLQIDNIFP